MFTKKQSYWRICAKWTVAYLQALDEHRPVTLLKQYNLNRNPQLALF